MFSFRCLYVSADIAYILYKCVCRRLPIVLMSANEESLELKVPLKRRSNLSLPCSALAISLWYSLLTNPMQWAHNVTPCLPTPNNTNYLSQHTTCTPHSPLTYQTIYFTSSTISYYMCRIYIQTCRKGKHIAPSNL